MSRLRQDYENGVLLDGYGNFEDIDSFYVSNQLGDFLEIETSCIVERLRMGDVKAMVRCF